MGFLGSCQPICIVTARCSTYDFNLDDAFTPVLPAWMVLEEVFLQIQSFLCRTAHSFDGKLFEVSRSVDVPHDSS